MEYLHPASTPASKSELNLFTIPPTQVAIESTYETDYRPSQNLDNGKTFEINIPASEDFTDLSATMVHMKVYITNKDAILKPTEKITLVENFANAIFEQIDLYLGSTNTSLANNMYHYQAFLEDLLFRHPTEAEAGSSIDQQIVQGHKVFELYFKLHLPMCSQDKLLLNGIPLSFRFTRSSGSFPIIKETLVETEEYSFKIQKFSLHIKRMKLYPDTQTSIIKTLEQYPAKYFITRSDTRNFFIAKGLSSISVENIFSGALPRKCIIGFVYERAISGYIDSHPFKLQHFNVAHISLNIDGVMFPSIPYTPEFANGNAMREFVELYRTLGQDEGIAQLNLQYEKYKDNKVLYAFDIGGELGAEIGVLSLVKRGKARLEVRFSQALASTIKAIVFAQYDNLITIDKDRQVTIDY
ncbi:uncharacterized protein LOC107365393 [Tetranychus urticae]|uniref:uncharacterized protein LOC107365393 n=1 Tax=Tetranychus urticae TaxID=32264 RepID=UPI00077BC433|nr:uncharacterized protein LOC107365393 [Tetranychus urticae]